MGFNAIFLNPIHYTGFSGSLYAVKDYYRFNPLFFPGSTEDENKKLFMNFVGQCHKSGMKCIIDLVINHTAKDSELTVQHKDWYVLKEGKIQSPGVWSGNKKVVEWGDLAEIDNKNSPDCEALWQYWKELLNYYTEMGIDGFRCDAAYQVPNELWQVLISHAKDLKKGCLFLAESLGCTIQETVGLVEAGFDYVFNSVKYWDFTEEWALDQHNILFRNSARSISFPESHDTRRVAEEFDKDIRQAKLRYLLTAVFSSGVMIPLGYEFGFTKKTDVKSTTPDDWEAPSYDLQDFILKVNEIKKQYPIFHEDSEIRLISNKFDPVLSLLMIASDQKSKVFIILNKDRNNYKRFFHPHLHALLQSSQIRDISPENVMTEEIPDSMEYWLQPSQIKIFYSSTNDSKEGK